MRKKMWHSLILVALLMLVVGLVQAQGVAVTPAGELPIVTEPTTIRIMMVQTTGVQDYNNGNRYTEWLEEQTGLNLEFEIVPSADAQAKLNVTLASGELPEVLAGFNMDAGLVAQQGAEGQFLPLNDLIEEYGYWTKAAFYEERPHLLSLITSPDGNVYGLPDINECFHCFMSQKLWIYQPWLDAVGMEVPTTTEELYEVLLAFKEQDPNGNGIADEVPMSAMIWEGGWHQTIEEFIMQSFVYYDRLSNASQQRMFLDENGQIQAAYAQPGYADGLRYLRRLYAEGLIDPNAFTQDNSQIRTLANNPDTNILGATPGGWPGMFAQVQFVADGGRLEHWVNVPVLEGPNGFRQTAYAPWGIGKNAGWVVTSAAQNPEAAFRLGDFMYSLDSTIRNVFGEEGVDWAWASEGMLGINGEPALYDNLHQWTEEIQNQSWQQAAIQYRTSEFRLGQNADGEYIETLLFQATNENMLPYAPSIDRLIPPLVFSEDQARELADLRLGIETYVDEMKVNYIIGNADIEADWENYVVQLDALGLPRLLEIMQEAYDAQSGMVSGEQIQQGGG
jgi:putative aldouronate transport system substrate-binding protein